MRILTARKILLTLLSFFVLASFCISKQLSWGAPLRPQRALPHFLLGGIQIREPDQALWSSALKTEGMNSVSVTTYAEHSAWNSDQISFNPEDQEALDQIQAAKKAELSVIFIPRVRLNADEKLNRFTWHGMIMPSDDMQLTSWFNKYSTFVLTWAEVCEREGVEVFSIGSELTELTSTSPVTEFSSLHTFYLQSPRIENFSADDSQSKHRAWAAALTFEGSGDIRERIELVNQRKKRLLSLWRGLIREVRAVFKGHITYAANFDAFKSVAFWGDLDLVGINAYFELRGALKKDDGVDIVPQLIAGWGKALNATAQFLKRAAIKRQVLFTEIGYTRRAGSTVYPWDHEGIRLPPSPTLDPTERVLAVRALATALKVNKIQFLKGLLYWRLSTMEREREYEPYLAVVGSSEDEELFRALREVAVVGG